MKKLKGIIMGKWYEKWYGRIEIAKQLVPRTAFCRILELLVRLSVAVSITKICNTNMKLSFFQTLFSSDMLHSGKNAPKFLPAGPFSVFLMKCLSKCPSFMKPPFLWNFFESVPVCEVRVLIWQYATEALSQIFKTFSE